MKFSEYSDSYRDQVVSLMALLQDHEAALEHSRPPGREIAAGHFDYLLACCRQQRGKVFIALEGESVAGFVVVLVESEDRDDRHLYEPYKTYGLVTDLAVAENYRGRGIAGSLMAEAERHVRDLGLATLQVSALARNQLAASFYLKSGYRPYTTTYIKDM